jgi:hypothetical protein
VVSFRFVSEILRESQSRHHQFYVQFAKFYFDLLFLTREFFPIMLSGREKGINKFKPLCNCLSKNPASILASSEKGGVFTSPFNQTRTFSSFFIRLKICHIRHKSKSLISAYYMSLISIRFLLHLSPAFIKFVKHLAVKKINLTIQQLNKFTG